MRHFGKSVMIVVMMITLGVLAQIGPVSAAVTVDLTVQDSVTAGVAFTVSVKVTNDSTTDTVTWNKVAAVYLLSDLKYKGPFQVDNTTRTLGPGLSTTFTFPFTINYTRGCIVPLAVTLFNNKYDFGNAIALNAIGVNINK
jgi:hypothetical protein